ncbi:MAG: hypothetical protein ABW123_27970 [Cystobacter sp.]
MLSTEPLFVEGKVPVFRDHADPDQFWYLPPRVALARRDDNGRAVFSFISYRDPEGKGGGFLSFEVSLSLPKSLQQRIESRLKKDWSENPRLTLVPFTDGTVKAIALDAQSGPMDAKNDAQAPQTATTTDPASEARSGPAAGQEQSGSKLIHKVLGSAKPSLYGDNSAIFTLALDPVGVQVLETSIKGGQAILGVMYELQYLAMQPPLHVKIEADMQQVYDALSISLKGKYKVLKADISATLEKLRKTDALKIQRTDTEGTEASGKQLDDAMAFFTDIVTQQWFEAGLTPGSSKMTPAEAPDPVDPETP